MKGDREKIEKTADRLRDDLVITLRELERRREVTLDVRAQISEHPDVLTRVALGLGLLTLVGMGVAVFRYRGRDERRSRDRWRAVRRVWDHPERVATRAAEPPVGTALLKKAAIAFLTTLAVQAAKRASVKAVNIAQVPAHLM